MIGTSLPKKLMLAAIVPLALGAYAADVTMKPADHKKLGKLVAGWSEAKDESKGINKAYVGITQAIEKLEKKMKVADALTLVEDWEKAFFLARLENLGKDIKLKKGKVTEASAALANGSEAEFGVFAPGSYNPKKGPYPLFLVIGDEGSTPATVLEEQWADEAVRGSAILLVPKMPDDVGIWDKLEADKGMGGIGTIMSLYGKVLGEIPIDMDRVYLVGHGAGAAAAARAADLYPQLFAGLVVVDGKTPLIATNFRNLPTLAVGSGDGSEGLATAIGALGYENCTKMDSATAADIWGWSEDKVRNAYPSEITFSPGHNYTTSAHWLSLQGVDVEAGPRVEARIDKDANAIVIDAKKVTSIEISFNDILVDMDKPVDVIINGTSNPSTIARNKRLMLELNYKGGDWGRVFTNRMSFDVPVAEEK